MAFTNTLTSGVELWILDINNTKATKISQTNLNANMGTPFTWYKDSKSLLVTTLPSNRKVLIDTKEAIPTGPTVSISEAGVEAQNRTYQDLLKNKTDEFSKGMAVYNVTPDSAGIYFQKIQCFCFDEQTLEPNQEVDMPISFYIDPEFQGC